ncbi:ABC-type multidrug transport system, ATPase and permease component [Hyella patelloides LEGE 07179]|uniref:ABC-type multidrug transport system, ATPase and permease component n=1 Tax=Hyella patelloides LEGE 07179 TaxID=945734 RepID=A0A563VPI3_9CYAN|nr:ABC transporter ATP-binding protein [Hyella patelloides]VEP13378.1 ABC-type multidrug transport system, ATPase and permease component [Hyella patelloides LEGE 07179]
MPSSQLLYAEYKSDRPLQTLINLYRRDFSNIGLSLLFFLIKHSPEWLRPLIVANIIDIISQPAQHSLRELWLNGAVLGASILQNIPTHYLHRRYMSLATRKMESRLRIAIAQRLQQLSLSFYHKHNTGALQSKLLRDVEAIQVLTNQIFQFFPSTLITICIAIVVTAIRVPWFLLFFGATVPIAAILIKMLRKPLKERNHALRQQMESMSARLIEMIKLIPLTRAHGVETTEMSKTEGKLDYVQQAAIRVDSINAITNASSWVTLRLFSSICLVTSASLAFTDRMNISIGDVVLLTGYFDSLTMAIVQILNVLPQLGKGFEAISSIGEILESSELEQNQGKAALSQVRGSFLFERVSFGYPHTETIAITDFSLRVEPGETIALVGYSGAGKSTLLNLIIGFVQPTGGKILLDGRDLSTLDKRTYRRFISVVSQETILFAGTVRENILYGSEGVSDTLLQQAIEDANAREFIEELPQGLETTIGENGVKLSGGQRQRLAIARALIRNPRVLILDEATASLDTASESLIQSALERLMQQRTTFVVAHRFSTIRQADRIVVLEKGKIAEIGNYDRLLANRGIFATLHGLQI